MVSVTFRALEVTSVEKTYKSSCCRQLPFGLARSAAAETKQNVPAVMDVHVADMEPDQRAFHGFPVDGKVGRSVLSFYPDALVHVVLFRVEAVEVSVDRKALLSAPFHSLLSW